MDPASDKFVESLKLMCTKTAPEYSDFMTVAGSCMITCKGENPELFVAEHKGACTWYEAHKGNVCAGDATTSGNATTSAAATGASSSAAAPTGSTTPVDSSVFPPPSPSNIVQEGSANKLQISGLAMALVAGVGYLAL